MNTILSVSDDIPVVFAGVLNMVEPPPNVTGISLLIPPERIITHLQKFLPRARRIAILSDPRISGAMEQWYSTVLKSAGFVPVPITVHSPAEVLDALQHASGDIDVLCMIPDTTVYRPKQTETIFLFCLRAGIPIIGLAPNFVKAGALFSLSANYEISGREAYSIAHRILSNTPATTIPVQMSSYTVLSLNLRVAERFNVSIPEELRKEASYVFK
jgi:putative ABC transport system substrate-binding protein